MIKVKSNVEKVEEEFKDVIDNSEMDIIHRVLTRMEEVCNKEFVFMQHQDFYDISHLREKITELKAENKSDVKESMKKGKQEALVDVGMFVQCQSNKIDRLVLMKQIQKLKEKT